MTNIGRIIGKSVGVTLVAALLVTAVVLGVRMRPLEVPCSKLTYIIEDRKDRLYLTESELDQMLLAEKVYPVGRTLDRGVLHHIEQTVKQHPMVRTAQCYMTPRGEVRVRLTQRVPLLLVSMPGDSYFVDTDRKVMPVRVLVKDDVLKVTGAVGVQMACKSLGDFAVWLQDNAYWRQRIRYVQVKNPQMVYVYLSNERVVLGSMNRYEQKLKKLRTFLENGADAIQDKHYYEWDVRFKGQVIGRWQGDK